MKPTQVLATAIISITITALFFTYCKKPKGIKEPTHDMCIGRYAGARLTTQSYCVLIGDFPKNDTTQYKDCMVKIDYKFDYFKTPLGTQLESLIYGFQIGTNNNPDSNQIIRLENNIYKYWFPDLQKYFQLKQKQDSIASKSRQDSASVKQK